MDNDNTEPVFTVGTLPKKCYTDPQELLNDFAAALSVPTDNAKVIKGAQGIPGPPGSPGPVGGPGPPGDAVLKSFQNIAIPEGVTYVEVPVFDGWQSSTYQIIYNGYEDHPDDPDFGDLDVNIGVGTIVPVYGSPSVTSLKVHLIIISDTVTETPDNKFLLAITTIA